MWIDHTPHGYDSRSSDGLNKASTGLCIPVWIDLWWRASLWIYPLSPVKTLTTWIDCVLKCWRVCRAACLDLTWWRFYTILPTIDGINFTLGATMPNGPWVITWSCNLYVYTPWTLCYRRGLIRHHLQGVWLRTRCHRRPWSSSRLLQCYAAALTLLLSSSIDD